MVQGERLWMGFDLLVLPVRSDKRRQEDYAAYAQKIVEVTQDAPVALDIPVETVYYSIPFTQDSLAYREVSWPPYQLSYYLSSLNGAVLDNGGAEKTGWVLRDVEVENTSNAREVLSVDIPSKGRAFVLEWR